jgi:membrane protease YdiL (CAAX protease family)
MLLLDIISMNEKIKNKKHYFILAAHFLMYLFILGAALYLVSQKILAWPFHGRPSLSENYYNIFIYMPVFLITAVSLSWLKLSDISFWQAFNWTKTDSIFFLGLAISAGYSYYLFISVPFNFKGYEYLPPILILCFLNALSEEIFFRLIGFELLKKVCNSNFLINILQSLWYATAHFFIGGVKMFLLAFAYGFILGIIRRKDDSITPCILCHFLIDIGNIGVPMLIILPQH